MMFDGIRLVYSIICIVFPFVLLHSDNFQKTKLLMGLTQLVMLKVAFQEECLEEHLSVIACWNRYENIYMMG